MESLIQQAAALSVEQARRAGEIQATLEATAAASEAQLHQTEGKLDQKTADLEQLEQKLKNRIHDLESQLREKEEILGVRSGEVEDLRSKLEEGASRAAADAQRAQEIEQNFAATVAALETQLGEKDALSSQTDITYKKMEESLTGLEESLVNQIRILERHLEEMVRKAVPETPEPAKKKTTSRKSPKRR